MTQKPCRELEKQCQNGINFLLRHVISVLSYLPSNSQPQLCTLNKNARTELCMNLLNPVLWSQYQKLNITYIKLRGVTQLFNKKLNNEK